MKIIESEIPDVLVIEPRVYEDSRGYFYEFWNNKEFTNHGLDIPFVQDNLSKSIQHTIRGLHYQIKNIQGKLINCAFGEVYDVIVDLRSDKSTFGNWLGVYLSGDNKRMLYVPPGFAHGFYVISTFAIFQYKCTDFYTPEHEFCIKWNDPSLKIKWPIPKGINPIVSPKDKNGNSFNNTPYL